MAQSPYTEPFRPQYHFSPPAGWMNDPNGLLYYEGEYHLYYQAIPHTHENKGPKHWGLALSRDLVHWQPMPIALYPDELGEIWSGSAVVDWHNSSGLQSGREKVLVALYTNCTEDTQQQSLAYSNDRGRSWAKYEGNPVIPNSEYKDFRDPKVFWHPPTGRWIMILVAGHQVMIYTSADLKRWEFASQFGADEDEGGPIWECPDLFPLPVDSNEAEKKWVMLVSLWGAATRYFVGDFDGRSFTNASPPQTVNWLDYGCDNYATITFSDVPHGRRLGIGWMSNWLYAEDIPTSPWRSAMTLPRELSLTSVPHHPPQLISQPIKELETLRGQSFVIADRLIEGTAFFPDVRVEGCFEILLDCELGTAHEFSLSLKNEQGEQTLVGYNHEARHLFIDRQHSGRTDFSPDFAGQRHTAPWLPPENKLRLHLFVDWSSVELFVDNGRLVMTGQVFPTTPYNQLAFYANSGSVHLTRCQIWQLDSIW